MEIFHAKNVQAEEHEGVLTIAFSDDASDPLRYLLVQRQIEPSKQDLDLGHDAIFLEINSQEYSTYGGINHIELCPNKIALSLTKNVALNLKQGVSIEVSFDPMPEASLNKLRSALQVLANDVPFVDRA